VGALALGEPSQSGAGNIDYLDVFRILLDWTVSRDHAVVGREYLRCGGLTHYEPFDLVPLLLRFGTVSVISNLPDR
jgi:hypothetical protein